MNRNGLFGELMAEFFGTFILILGGDGVVANVGLAPRLACEGYDWNVIVWGWGLSVMVAVYVAGGVSGAHINPAVTLGFAFVGEFPWSQVPGYMLAQVAGARRILEVGTLGGYSTIWLARALPADGLRYRPGGHRRRGQRVVVRRLGRPRHPQAR